MAGERPAADTDVPPPWSHCFVRPNSERATIELEQLDTKCFALRSSLRYTGPTDVEAPRQVDPADLPRTDLTSVPKSLRWFVSPYGLHTPAALLHDRLVGEEEATGVSRTDADRLFRQILDCLEVPFLRRWLMWAAVAYGTRWAAKGWTRVAIVGWTIVAVVGMAVLVVGIATASPAWIAVSALLPFPAALLWGRQYGGGLIAAASGPWLATPALVAAVGYGVYWVLEWLLARLPLPRESRPPATPNEF